MFWGNNKSFVELIDVRETNFSPQEKGNIFETFNGNLHFPLAYNPISAAAFIEGLSTWMNLCVSLNIRDNGTMLLKMTMLVKNINEAFLCYSHVPYTWEVTEITNRISSLIDARAEAPGFTTETLGPAFYLDEGNQRNITLEHDTQVESLNYRSNVNSLSLLIGWAHCIVIVFCQNYYSFWAP